MIYQGNKARLRKYIIPILQKCIDENKITNYIEPFVGGANVIDHINCKNRIGSDCNDELISLLEYMKSDSLLSIFPAECSFEHYEKVRDSRKNNTHIFSKQYISGIGYFASYAGRYFDGGYGRDKTGKRNIYAERLKYAREQAPLLKDISFYCRDYTYYKDFENCVFYLDPPYRNTTNYNNKDNFDYEKFYDFIRYLSKRNYVFISEYSMPSDFTCIWSKERKVMQQSDRKKGEIVVEKLFIYKNFLLSDEEIEAIQKEVSEEL